MYIAHLCDFPKKYRLAQLASATMPMTQKPNIVAFFGKKKTIPFLRNTILH